MTIDGDLPPSCSARDVTDVRRTIGRLDLADGGITELAPSGVELCAPKAPHVFPDQSGIVFVDVDGARATGSRTFYVGRCDDVRRCDELSLHRIEGLFGLANPLQVREIRIAPDSTRLFWSIVRGDGYAMMTGLPVPAFDEPIAPGQSYTIDPSSVRVLRRPELGGSPSEIEWWTRANGWEELKSFPSAHEVTYGGSTAASNNVDGYVLDLRTAEPTRITTRPAWDEWIERAPDGRWNIGSRRGRPDVSAPFALLTRPPIMDPIVIGPLMSVFLNEVPRRGAVLSTWVLPSGGDERGPGFQVLADPLSGNRGTARLWSSDGRHLAFPLTRYAPLTVVELDSPPSEPESIERMEIGPWAPRLPQLELAFPPRPPSATVMGGEGTLEIHTKTQDWELELPGGDASSPSWRGPVITEIRASYDDFEYLGGILDGSEHAYYERSSDPSNCGRIVYSVDLRRDEGRNRLCTTAIDLRFEVSGSCARPTALTMRGSVAAECGHTRYAVDYPPGAAQPY